MAKISITDIYDFIFIVLVYRNTEDLRDFFYHLCIPNSKVIVVNSFYDKISDNEFKNIAEEYHADYLSVPNRGYGAGNNRGVEHAVNKYSFKYLVVSNADVVIKKMKIDVLKKYQNGIYAPSIHTLREKQQNPHMPYYCSLIDRIKYYYFEKNNWKMIMFFCALNKVFRIFFSFMQCFGVRKIYSAHGAFVIIPSDICKQIYPFYDENVFLFTEEENLAQVAKSKKIATYFVPEIEILHKEDGSTSSIADKQREITRQSYITYWNKWYNK